ncbi:MAG: hypothetical protein ACREM2_04775, partial [Vulcanimicrobiaceae bacterium]
LPAPAGTSGSAASASAQAFASAPPVPNAAALHAEALALRATLTADYQNDEDSIQRPGKLREDIDSESTDGGPYPPTQAQRDFAARVVREYNATMPAVERFLASVPASLRAPLPAKDDSGDDEGTSDSVPFVGH